MIAVVRPLLARPKWVDGDRGALTRDRLATLLLMAFASAWVTERLGLHSVFGAFLMGCVLPRDRRLARALEEGLGGAVILLLPLFFAETGLRTSVRLLNGVSMWLVSLVIILSALAGKVGRGTHPLPLPALTGREGASLGVPINPR